jgi:hypothetical protein
MSGFSRTVGIGAMLTTLSLGCGAASADHLFVSPFGNDGGTGTAFQPFLTLQGAVNAADAGDVIQLEMGGNYGGAIINDKTLTIMSTAGGGVIEPGAAGIVFNGVGNNDILTIVGLTIDQAGSGNNGITFNSGRKLNVFDSLIQNGTGGASGVFYQPDDAFSELNIRNSTFSGFGTVGSSAGIRIAPRAGGDVDVLIEDVLAINNRFAALTSAGSGSVIDALYDEFLASGGGTGVQSSGTGSTVRLRNSVISNNATGLSHPGTAKLISLGGNSVRANTANGTFTATEPPE